MATVTKCLIFHFSWIIIISWYAVTVRAGFVVAYLYFIWKLYVVVDIMAANRVVLNYAVTKLSVFLIL